MQRRYPKRSFLLSLFSKDLAILLTASLLVCSCPSAAVTFAATNEAAAGITHLTESGSTSGAENISLGTGSNAASPANGSNNQTKSASEGTASDADEIINNLARTSGKHSITVLLGSASAESAARGDVVTLNAVLSVGELNFSSWTSTNPDVVFKDPTAANTTFVMPDSEVEITAEYGEAAVLPAMSALSLLPSQKNTPTYRLELINTTAVVNGGPVQTGNITVYPADNITLTDIPSNLAMTLSGWNFTSSGESLPALTGNNFTMPNINLSVAPEYKAVSLYPEAINGIAERFTGGNYNFTTTVNTVNSILSATANMTSDQLDNLSAGTQSVIDQTVNQCGNVTFTVQAVNADNAEYGNSLTDASASGLSTAVRLSSVDGASASVQKLSGGNVTVSNVQSIKASFMNQAPFSLDSSAGNVSISNFNGNYTALVSNVQPANNTFVTDSDRILYVVGPGNVSQESVAVISSADLQKLKSEISSGSITVGNVSSLTDTDINNTASNVSSNNSSGYNSAVGNIPAYSGFSGNSITSGNYTLNRVYNADSLMNIVLDLQIVSSAGTTRAEARNRLYTNLTFANPIPENSMILHSGNDGLDFYGFVSSPASSVPYNWNWSSVAIFEPAVLASPSPSPVKITESSLSGNSGDSGRGGSEGSWIRDNIGWWYRRQNGTYPSGEWAYLWYNGRYDWYYFNADGYMATGFLTWNGNRYYLNPVSDGTQGRMLTGKQLIDGKSCYFREEKDGLLGSLAEEAKLET